MLLRNYFELFRQAIEKLENYGYTESIEIKEEIRPNKQAIIKAKIVLVDSSVLHIKEYIDAKYTMEKVSYAYQYQDRDGELIFRYDNAVHRPALGFKEHKHTKDGVITEQALPDVSEIVDEVVEYL
ncbi:MAG: hypothetical protein BBJ57_05415 [Desulfobacterales bacterium PC51MH44]|nr:MAG: hypothetical protein BBJ57_05415 [Desulfobacterales bacterium PC51MH44]